MSANPGNNSPAGRRVAAAVAGGCALAALIVLAGWVLSLPALTTFGRNWTPMVASTALVILGAGVAGWLVAMRPDRAGRAVHALGALAAVIGAVTLADFLAAYVLGRGLYPAIPALRMAPNTAVAALSLGIALVSWNRSRRATRLAETLLVITLVIAVVMLLAFLFGAAPKSELLGKVNMSPITGLCLLGVSGSLLASVPGGLIRSVLGGSGTGSQMARPFLAVAILVPVLLGWFRLRAELAGWFGLAYGVSVMVIGTGISSAWVIFAYAARVNRYEQRQRVDQERRLFLGRASDLLAQSLDPKTTLAAVAELCVPALADWCSIALCTGDGRLENVAVVHQDPAKLQWAREYQRRFPPDLAAPRGVGAVARTGTPEFLPDISEAALLASIADPGQLEVIRALGIRSALSVPLVAGGRTVGVLTLVTSESGRLLDEEDLRFAGELADRCAAAIERARMFSDLRTLTAELEQRVAQRTAELAATNHELESFAYSVSHDLRTPLRALDGFSQALLEDYGDRLDDNGKNYLDRIRRGSQRMGDLIDALLDLSRVTRSDLQRQPVNLSAIAADILNGLREAAPERQVEARIQPGLAVTGDPRLLRALLQNLLGNAWKFTSKRPDARIAFGVENGNGRPGPVFVVRDNGAGFDMAHASKLFGAFQRLHTPKEFEGSGVGLATVQRIVHRHAGEVWAEAAPGRGAAFYFTLGREEATS